MDHKHSAVLDQTISALRIKLLQDAKDFKISWVELGQTLHSVWKDKLFREWGFEKFEYYTKEELGLKKELSMKLLKTYFFLEQEEPQYLDQNFSVEREAQKVPGYEEVNLLRLAKNRKELTKDDYGKLRRAVFEKGKNATAVRRDLVALMKERRPVNPEEEKQQENQAAFKKLVNALKNFEIDMENLKLAPYSFVEQSQEFRKELESYIS